MIVRSYLKWFQTAQPDDRADAVSVLVNVYLAGELGDQDRRDAQAALFMALDDPAPKVRRAIAEALGGSEYAPRPIVIALSHDLPDIACIVLANSPVMSDADLVDAAAVASPRAQEAIAARPYVSLVLSAALAEVAGPSALIVLLNNEGAEIAVSHLARMVERHGSEAALREAMLARQDLPSCIRASLALAATEQLTSHVRAMGWLADIRTDRMERDCREMSAITIASEAQTPALIDVVRTLRQARFLTPQLLLRAVLSGEDRFLAAALAELSGLTYERAFSIVGARHQSGLRALCRKAGVPAALEPAFEAALAALHQLQSAREPVARGRLSARIIEQVMVACSTHAAPELGRLLPVLARYQVEAMREESRARLDDLMSSPEPLVLPDFEAEQIDLVANPAASESLQIEYKKAA
jgi:uncharacterized protein (DUF2336 family)